MQWLGTIPLHSFDKRTPDEKHENVTAEKLEEKVAEHKTTESTNTTIGANHNVCNK